MVTIVTFTTAMFTFSYMMPIYKVTSKKGGFAYGNNKFARYSRDINGYGPD